jgi:predicted DNA-binding protein with PD1-like motif
MRRVEHPGPVHPERVQCSATNLQVVDVELQEGSLLLDALADVVRLHGVQSAVFTICAGSFDPLRYYMPALSPTADHVAYFSEPFNATGEATIESGSITFGLRNGEPSIHCHAIWSDSNGQRRSGHLIPAECRVAETLRLQAWMLNGAGFEVMPDAETNFNLLQLSNDVTKIEGTNAFVVRLRPNQDICVALENLCTELGIAHASIRGGVGSLIGATFVDGRVVEPFVTEVFIKSGMVEHNDEGLPRADIDVGLVAHSGEIAEGRLARGENPVLITFELVLEPHEQRSKVGSSV